MPTVSLPMYLVDETAAAHGDLLSSLATQLGDGDGLAQACLTAAQASSEVKRLAADQHTCETLWGDHGLVLTQMCGLGQYDSTLTSEPRIHLATPDYSARGCGRGTYLAWIVVRTADEQEGTYTCLSDLSGARVAVNHLESYSGCIGLRAAVALLEPRAVAPLLFFHQQAVVTGSHRLSMEAVRDGKADCASIDCVTWAMLGRVCPEAVAGLSIIGCTPSAPAPPFVTAATQPPHVRQRLRKALRATMTREGDGAVGGAQAAVLDALMIRGVVLAQDHAAEADGGDDGDARRRKRLKAHGVGPSGEGGVAATAAECARKGPREGPRALAADDLSASAIDGERFAFLRGLAARVPLGDRAEWSAAASGAHFWARLDASGYTFPICGGSVAAQRWLDRGMLLVWGFNMEEAVRCFRAALDVDADCALAHWGMALALGVNYNKVRLTHAEMRVAASHIAQAAALAHPLACAPDAARDAVRTARLVRTLQARLAPVAQLGGASDDEPVAEETHAALNAAYERELRGLLSDAQLEAQLEGSAGDDGRGDGHGDGRGAGHGDGRGAASALAVLVEVSALFAEGMMTPRAWRLWPADGTAPASEVVEARNALELALTQRSHARHPGVAHFYVHLMEAAPHSQVDRATHAAAMLRSQWPATGHLLHMASHIDMHLGHYAAAVRTGERAVHADEVYALHSAKGRDCYYYTYRNHHAHQLCWAAMLAGNLAATASAADRIVADTPRALFDLHLEFQEPLHALPWHVDMRFGRWAALLRRALPAEPQTFRVTLATAHWARALAFSALGEIESATQEQALFHAALDLVPASRYIHNVTSRAALAVGRALLDGELAYRQRKYPRAFGALRRATQLEDALPYDEPWGWMTPTRHALGALLLERAAAAAADSRRAADAGQAAQLAHESASCRAEAEATFRADLQRYPNNLWALTGLRDCIRARQPQAAAGGIPPGDAGRQDELGGEGELSAVEARLARALSGCDVDVRHSCFCAGMQEATDCCGTG